MAIFNSYVKLPEGRLEDVFFPLNAGELLRVYINLFAREGQPRHEHLETCVMCRSLALCLVYVNMYWFGEQETTTKKYG